MDGQMTVFDYFSQKTTDKWLDRRGNLVPAPDWVRPDRCQKCVFWEMDILDDQPPDGWGVYGTCHYLREGHRGYHHTEETSYCDMYREKHISGKENE